MNRATVWAISKAQLHLQALAEPKDKAWSPAHPLAVGQVISVAGWLIRGVQLTEPMPKVDIDIHMAKHDILRDYCDGVVIVPHTKRVWRLCRL